VALDRAVFDATEKNVGRTLRIASIQGALGHAQVLGADVVALERLAADGDALRVRTPVTLIERLVGSGVDCRAILRVRMTRRYSCSYLK
jgi:hypothetical protein